MPLTLKEMAIHIAKLDGRAAEIVHTQLRNPAVRELLEPVPADRGRTSAHKYPAREMIRARILAALLDIGFDAKAARECNGALLGQVHTGLGREGRPVHPPSARTDGGIHYAGQALDQIIKGAQHPENWELRARFTRTSEGERRVSWRVTWDEWDRDDQGERIVDSALKETRLGLLTIPVTDLVRPLLGRIDI